VYHSIPIDDPLVAKALSHHAVGRVLIMASTADGNRSAFCTLCAHVKSGVVFDL
jgi:hypothetical protein